MESSPDFLPPLHPPGRSGTASAWSAFIAFLLLIAIGILHPMLLRGSVRALLWVARPITGLTIQAEALSVVLGEPLRWNKVTITSGVAPHQSRLELQALTLELSSPWRMIFGDHVIINKLQASHGTALIDLCNEDHSSIPRFLKQPLQLFHDGLQQKITEIPASLFLRDISLLFITEDQRYSIDHLSCLLPKKEAGQLSYDSMFIEAGTIKCHLTKGACDASWDGKTLSLKNLPLSEEITLRSLQLTPHTDRIELGLSSTVFHGLLRADGCIRKNGFEPTLDGAILGQQLPMERLSKFLGLTKKISGNLREGRLIFRGSPLHLIDAEASLRMLVDHFRWGKKEWASLAMAANLIGRKISVTDFQLKQHENRVNAAGELTLPEQWRKIGQAPFHLKLKATITDASQLVDLVGSPWNDVTGQIFIDGEIQGASNRAEGYLNAQGIEMSIHEFPVDDLKLALLFHGDKTDLTNLDLWSNQDHLQLSGTIANSWPHQYEGKGTLLLNEGDKKLSSALAISSQGIVLRHFKLLKNDCTTLSGTMILPITFPDAFTGALIMTTPFDKKLPLKSGFAVFSQKQSWTEWLEENTQASELHNQPFLHLALKEETVVPIDSLSQLLLISFWR